MRHEDLLASIHHMASAPAGSASRKSGRLDIVCISEIMIGDDVIVAIVQTAAVSFIVVPIFEDNAGQPHGRGRAADSAATRATASGS